MGLIGEEFKTARHHLLKNLDGNIAWKDPAQAEKQKQRLAMRNQSDNENQSENENQNEDTEELSEDEESSGMNFGM